MKSTWLPRLVYAYMTYLLGGAHDVIRTIAAMLALAACSAMTVAQSPPDPLEACYELTDPTARLACFDHEMQRRHATAPPPSAITTAPAPATTVPADNVGLQGKQLHQKLEEQGVKTEPAAVKPIVATITRLLPRPDNEFAFELDNGQTWEQAESKSLNIAPHDTVTIQPGVLGAFFLTTEKGQRVRVHRVR